MRCNNADVGNSYAMVIRTPRDCRINPRLRAQKFANYYASSEIYNAAARHTSNMAAVTYVGRMASITFIPYTETETSACNVFRVRGLF